MKHLVALALLAGLIASPVLADEAVIDDLVDGGVLSSAITLPPLARRGPLCGRRDSILDHFRQNFQQDPAGTVTDAAGNEFLVTVGGGQGAAARFTLHWINGSSLCFGLFGKIENGKVTITRTN